MTQGQNTRPVREGEIVAGKYRVERIVGAGGMGVVVAAQHLQLHRRVALKLILPSVSSHPGSVERLLREARAAAGLRSQHVVRVLDVGTLDDGSPFIVMEFLEGHNLAEELKAHGRLPAATAVDYVLQACEALAEAHAQGIIHRDLKPENLFLTRTASGAPLIKVLDFGISKVASGDADAPLNLTSGILGSPLYMSPEQMRSSHDVDARADVWSLGIILYELLVGSPPFEATSLTELLLKVANGARPPLGKLSSVAPRGLVTVIARCLEQSPVKRYSSVVALAAALLPFAPTVAVPDLVSSGDRDNEPEPLGSTQGAWAERPTRPDSQRTGARWVMVTGALLVMAGGTAFGLFSTRSGKPPADEPPLVPPPIVSPWSAPARPDVAPEPSHEASPSTPSASAPPATNDTTKVRPARKVAFRPAAVAPAAPASAPPAAASPPPDAPAPDADTPDTTASPPAPPPPPPPTKAAPGGDDDIPRLRY